MFYAMKKNESPKDFSVSCDCGCGSHINFLFDADCEWANISLSESIFYTEQKTIRNIIKDRIKLAWYCPRGKGFHFFDIMPTPEQWKEFKKAVNNVDMSKRLEDNKKLLTVALNMEDNKK